MKMILVVVSPTKKGIQEILGMLRNSRLNREEYGCLVSEQWDYSITDGDTIEDKDGEKIINPDDNDPSGDLLPCPFCGSKKIETESWECGVHCVTCGARVPSLTSTNKAESHGAIEGWNKRAKVEFVNIKTRLRSQQCEIR